MHQRTGFSDVFKNRGKHRLSLQGALHFVQQAGLLQAVDQSGGNDRAGGGGDQEGYDVGIERDRGSRRRWRRSCRRCSRDPRRPAGQRCGIRVRSPRGSRRGFCSIVSFSLCITSAKISNARQLVLHNFLKMLHNLPRPSGCSGKESLR